MLAVSCESAQKATGKYHLTSKNCGMNLRERVVPNRHAIPDFYLETFSFELFHLVVCERQHGYS